MVSNDDTVRLGVTAESLANLKPVFPGWGKSLTTAGNASGVGDGAAIAILTTCARAEKEGWEVVAKWGGCSVAGEWQAIGCLTATYVTTGVKPRVMGIGPVAAILKVLAQTGLNRENIDVWEVSTGYSVWAPVFNSPLSLDQ